MSNLIINWRFGRWFFQVVRPSDWGRTIGSGPVTIKRHPQPRVGPEPWFALYQGGRYFLALLVLVALLIWWAV